MARMENDLMLVGSIPFPTVEDVFTTCSRLIGEYLPCMPDGEVGPRLVWAHYLYERYKTHPDIELQPIPKGMRGPFDERFSRVAKGRRPVHHLVVKRGVTRIRFGDLGYSAAAIDSYGKFTRLREQGVIPAHMRFQVAIPFTRSGFGGYFRRTEDYPILEEAYEEVANRELAEIVEAIPAHDLAIQWDVCSEILDIEDYYPWWPKGDRLEMNSEPALRLHLDRLPEQAWLGYHICYGTSGGWPMKKPEDVVLSVALSNALVKKTPRKVDFVHFPAGRKAFDPVYYAALEDLDIGDCKVYLGLIHDTEPDLQDFRKRHAAAKQHLKEFGLASVCGYGRCSPDEINHALEVHRDVMRDLHST